MPDAEGSAMLVEVDAPSAGVAGSLPVTDVPPVRSGPGLPDW
jgi:hypothetical protein